VLFKRRYFELLGVKFKLLFALRAKTIVTLNDLCGSFQLETVIEN